MRGAVRPHEQSGDDAAEFSKKRAAVSEERPESSDEGAIDGAGGVDLTRTDRGETRVLTGFILNCDDKKKKVSFKLMTREEPNDWHARVRVGDVARCAADGVKFPAELSCAAGDESVTGVPFPFRPDTSWSHKISRGKLSREALDLRHSGYWAIAGY